MNKKSFFNKLLKEAKALEPSFSYFMKGVVSFFQDNPDFIINGKSIIHTVKFRTKSQESLHAKIKRKLAKGISISPENFFDTITDVCGVRVLHLYQDQFPEIHKKIQARIDSRDWYLFEKPKAYTWDPESTEFFNNLGLETIQKPSLYTSIHYVVQPQFESSIKCEIQVRTLFEEIWGEIDHLLNYPNPVDSVACLEQLRVLSKLSSTGTRLSDSIFRTYDDYVKKNNGV